MKKNLLCGLLLFHAALFSASGISYHARGNGTIIHDKVFTTLSQEAAIRQDSLSATETARKAVNAVLSQKGESPWLQRINFGEKSFTLVHLMIYSIFLSIAIMIGLLIIILLNRRKLEREASLREFLKEKYQTLIIDYLFGNVVVDEFRKIASDPFRRQVLVDEMIDVSANLRSDDEKKLLGLYKHLELDKDSIRRAKDRRWHVRIKGFRELAFMNIRDANESIYQALNSKNEILRMEAQIALVRLNDNDPFEFLSHLTRPFSLWEQITLHDLLVQHSIPVPSFRIWLLSPNYTVVMFALRMIREFKQADAQAGVIMSFNHINPAVRQLVVQVAGDLNFREALEPMKRMYKNQDYRICLEIVRAMGKMPDTSMISFLKLVLDKEEDVQLQIEATKAIENTGEEGVKALVKLMKSEYKNYSILVRHVLDKRIY